MRTGMFASVASAAALTLLLAAPGTQAADDRLAQIESSGELRVCHAEDNPWTYRDPATGEWLGFTRDLAADLAAELGVELVDIDSTWKTIVPSVRNGECDIGGAGLFATVTRAKVVLFTKPFAYAHSTAIVHQDSGLSTYQELDQPGNLIIGSAGTATLEFAKRYFKNAEVKGLPVDTDSILLGEIANQRADGWWTTTTKGLKFLDENPQFKARLIGAEPEDYIAVSWAIDLGEYHFQQMLNTWLERHIRAGKTAKLWVKWFGNEYVRGDYL